MHDNRISVYPVPFNDKIFVTGHEFNSTYKVYGLSGILYETGNLEFEINFTSYKSGVYFLEINNGKENIIKRLIKY
jgi:hypothetical protein